jgi:hypothetical protein
MVGVYQHCSSTHLKRYLAEFDFRYNQRVALGIDDPARTEVALRGIVGKRLTFRLHRGAPSMEDGHGQIPSRVWLERFDRGSLLLRKPLFAFDACQRVDHIDLGAEDWKVRVSARIVAVALGQAGGDEIERRPQRVDDLPAQALNVSGSGKRK